MTMTTNSKIAIYGQANYDRSGKLRWLLEEAGAPYENRWLDTKKGDLESGDYLRVNPLGRIPAAVFDERPMIESGAIAAFIADRHGVAPALTSPERLDYQQWMYFAVTIDNFAARISIVEDIPPGEVATKKMGDLLSEAGDALGFLDQSLSTRKYLTGQFSAADVCVGYHLYFASLWPEFKALIEARPNVKSYLERLQGREAAKKAQVFSFES